MAIGALIPVLAPILGKVAANLFPDPAEAAKAEREMAAQLLAHSADLEQAAGRIILAEAKSEHWLTATWRPITMLSFVAIVVHNYIIFPYLRLFFPEAPMLVIPDPMWGLLTVGVGGYVASRGLEKVAPPLAEAWAKGRASGPR